MNEEDNFVTYGEPFEEDDAENSKFLHPKARPQAYEQRVLNERGRPMRFHGAFTGGFSAGYFNTVGSKEGFRPQSFSSSRRDRNQNPDQQVSSKPEDFMDEEDLGEFGIAPRHYRTRREFDDHHIFDTLSESLGGKSVIPDAGDILKQMIIPGGTSLADRLLRRMGWKSEEATAALTKEKEEDEHEENEKEAPCDTFKVNPSKERDYAVISFAPKTNTFGLGYSGLDPEIAWGRRAPTSLQDPQSESVSSLQQRERVSHLGFNPSAGLVRQGIRGQAFGVGALHSEDADIYSEDNLNSYDFSIGTGNGHDNIGGDDDADNDDEMADLEAARHGRFSDLRKRAMSKSTIDGWTPPTLPKVSLFGVEEASRDDLLDGFVKPTDSGACLMLANAEFFVIPKPVVIPPGYNPIFHPDCVAKNLGSSVEVVLQTPVTATPMIPPAALLRPFTSDSAKQARFEAYQLLLRRGFSHDDAYQRCSNSALELTEETRGFEANVFATLLRNLAPPPVTAASTESPKTQQQEIELDKRPLTAGILDAEKQRLVANLLKSRFRSAGEMDIAKELTEAQEEERRKDVMSLDRTDPRDNAAANDSYGVLTRRILVWHPAALLCKRVNVPNPYPNSTFVGCPEDRRFRHPPRRGRRRRDDITSSEFSLFQLLDINVGAGGGSGSDVEDDADEEEDANMEQMGVNDPLAITDPLVTSTMAPNGPPPSIFDALFAESDKAQQSEENTSGGFVSASPIQTSRIIGPSTGPTPANVSTNHESGCPSMELFKSIFASDEELDDDDVEELEAEVMVVRPVPPVRDDNEDIVEDASAPPSPSKPSVPDLSVHQLFRHLFNPEMDSEAPLHAVMKVAHQRKEEKRAEDAETMSSLAPRKIPTEEDFYGPTLPPDFGTALETSSLLVSSDAFSEAVQSKERKRHHKDSSDKKHKKHSHKSHHKHHKHRKLDKH